MDVAISGLESFKIVEAPHGEGFERDAHLLDALDDGLPIQVHFALIELDAIHAEETLHMNDSTRFSY